MTDKTEIGIEFNMEMDDFLKSLRDLTAFTEEERRDARLTPGVSCTHKQRIEEATKFISTFESIDEFCSSIDNILDGIGWDDVPRIQVRSPTHQNKIRSWDIWTLAQERLEEIMGINPEPLLNDLFTDYNSMVIDEILVVIMDMINLYLDKNVRGLKEGKTIGFLD